MVLSRRERYIVIAAAATLFLLALDRLVLTPLQTRREAMETERQRILDKLERGRNLLARRKQLLPKWQQLLDAGLKLPPQEAESQVLHAVRRWAQESGLNLSSLRTERATENKDLHEITFNVAGTGGMSAVAGLLWRIESSSMPVRVAELQLGTRKEGTDDLSVQLRVSAVCQPAPSEKKASSPGSAPKPAKEGARNE